LRLFDEWGCYFDLKVHGEVAHDSIFATIKLTILFNTIKIRRKWAVLKLTAKLNPNWMRPSLPLTYS